MKEIYNIHVCVCVFLFLLLAKRFIILLQIYKNENRKS